MQNKAKFLTIAQAAEFLNVSPDTLRRWEDRGIVTPQRTKGGSRRYTLLDLKIAKLNKRKTRFFQLPTLITNNYINSKRDLKIAILTSFLWIFGLLVFNFLTPIFLRPTNPEQHILSNALKEPTRLKMASETTPIKGYTIEIQLPAEETPIILKMTPSLIHQSDDLPTLEYTGNTNPYYSLNPVSKPSSQQPSGSAPLSFW